ncbi:MAG: rod shape-determining protein RodA [Aquificaceae bacterium]|nr:rod shape-determining protein RodA [Aquificaceae bacterium]MCX7990301.1 rod shape-determining protein RodA [Aquificaceae bacterium]MDW8294266.1 rod shape-determining protein RodA [Aquificaceae bacterium]
MKRLFRSFLSDYDPYLVFALASLCLVGLLGLYSATYKGGPSPLFIKQAVYLTAGWFIIILLSRLNFRTLYDLAPLVYFVNLFLLVLVPLFGKTVYGAKRWLDLGPINLQPSELFKFSFALFSLYTLSHTKRLFSRESLILLFAFALPSVLTLKQPDLGTTITYGVTLTLLLFFWGIRGRYFLLAGFTLALSSPLLWQLLKDYQKERILAVLDPYRDYHGSGYQLVQSVIAIGSGGLWGKGLLQGTQAHLLFLPEKHTDFIFSVIAEEWGLLGSILLVSLIFLIFYRVAIYALRTPHLQERAYLSVFAGLWLFQSLVNLMMTMGWAPVVGIPLPFVSYGGSSVLTFSLFMGLALSIIREQRNRPIRFEDG